MRPVAPIDPIDFADPAKRRQWIDEKGMIVLTLHDPENPVRSVDLFVEHPIDFERLWASADVLDAGGIPVRVASIDDLLEMKRMTGRARDQEDIDALETIRQNDSGDG